MRRRVQLAIGFAAYAMAFLLPAVKAMGQPSEPIQGWVCAWWALWIPFRALTSGTNGHGTDIFLLGLSGIVNPLVLAYVGIWAWPKFARIRWGLSAAVAIGIVSSWVYFSRGDLFPVTGHFVWVGGILIMLSAEITRQSQRLPESAA